MPLRRQWQRDSWERISKTGRHISREAWALISLLPSTLCPCRKLVSRDPLVPKNCADNPFSQEPAPTGKGGGQYIFDRSRFSTKGRSSLALGSVVSAGEGGMTLGEQWG